MERQIVYNGMMTPDGTILQSKHRHDYVRHEDKNGNSYFIDGGNEYARCSNNGDERLITIYDYYPIEVIRELMVWGKNYDENNNLLPETEWVLIKDITEDHLDALIEYTDDKWTNDIFKREKDYRNAI